MTTTAAERATDLERATWTLDKLREHFTGDGLLLVSATYGTGATDYFRTTAVTAYQMNTIYTGSQTTWSLTWAMSKVFGYSLRDRNGRMYLALNGGNYSKPDQLARDLAGYYGLERIRYEII